MNKFWSTYSGLITFDSNILSNPNLSQALMSCLRINEVPILNDKPLTNYKEIIN